MTRVERLHAALLARPFARMALLSSVGVTAAYMLGTGFQGINAQAAAITALFAVRSTFHASIEEGLRQTLGLIVGAGFTLGLMATVGVSPFALFLGALACWLAVRLTHLGEADATTLVVTVIVILGPEFNADAVESRFLGVALGSLIGTLVSLFVRPGHPHTRALTTGIRLAGRTAQLLHEIADHLSGAAADVTRVQVRGWLTRAQRNAADIATVRLAAEDAVAGAPWTPLVHRADAVAVLAQIRLTQVTSTATTNICRDLLAAAEGDLPGPLAASLSAVLAAAADAIVGQSAAARVHPAHALNREHERMRALTATRRSAIRRVRALEDTAPMLLGGALLADAETIEDALAASQPERGRSIANQGDPAQVR